MYVLGVMIFILSIQKSHEPELVFVDKDLRTVAEDNFNPYYYVIKAEDYRGKDINDKKHLAYKVKNKGKKYLESHLHLNR